MAILLALRNICLPVYVILSKSGKRRCHFVQIVEIRSTPARPIARIAARRSHAAALSPRAKHPNTVISWTV
jgi:hypothetical protein